MARDGRAASLSADDFQSGAGQKQLAVLRQRNPCAITAFDGVNPAWNLVRYDDVHSALRQPLLFSSGAGGTTLQDQDPEEIAHNRSMLHVDPPVHTALRRPFVGAFRHEAMSVLQETF